MTAAAGHGTLVLGLVVAVFGAASSFGGAALGASRLTRLGRAAALLLLPIALAASGALVTGLLRHDFSIAYVAENGSRETPTFYTAISLWAALEGSILLWIAILAGYTAVTALVAPRRAPGLYPVAQGVLFLVAAFFLWLAVSPADPFRTISPVPENGPGPNPLLQNHPLMGLHPPALYLGLVGFACPSPSRSPLS